MSLPPVFDAHLHIIPPSFPLIENQGFTPEYFSCEDYLERVSGLGVQAGAVVSGSFQGFDQSYLEHSLKILGPNFRGVTQLQENVSDDEILRLNELGVTALRFNLKRGGSADVSSLEVLATRVHELAGWHTELYADTARIDHLEALLIRLPRVSIDHLGLSQQGLPLLYRLAEKGVRVKATGFGRIDFDANMAIKTLSDIDPKAVMFGTDLPCTRAPSPFKDEHLFNLRDFLGESTYRNVTYNNAIDWYRISN